jgi:hypothetical protein
MPEEMLDEIRQIAREEERPLNTQLVRLIRAGLEQHRAAQADAGHQIEGER